MIETRTVFVLGAGASFPFGLPTGEQLRSQICSVLVNQATDEFKMLKGLGHDPSSLTLFAETFKRSGFNSIDRFLTMHPEVADLGRAVIAACIGCRQQEDLLYRVGGQSGSSDWYQYLFNLMADGVNSAADLVRENHVSFLTFNYDVSLERFFFNAIHHGYSESPRAAAARVDGIRIHHIYGSLASPSDAYGYSPTLAPATLRTVAENLRVMPHERLDADPKCLDYLVPAKRIFFLGFSYDAMNCLRLGIAYARGENPGQSVAGTAYRLTASERAVAAANLGGSRPGAPTLIDTDCLSLLRNHAADLRN